MVWVRDYTSLAVHSNLITKLQNISSIMNYKLLDSIDNLYVATKQYMLLINSS